MSFAAHALQRLTPMDLFETLVEDHRLISRVLNAFGGFLDEAETSGVLDVVELNRFVVFFREFVELLHHEREEEILFPAMESVGYSKKGAPLAHIHDQHERECALLLGLRKLAVAPSPLTAARQERVLERGRELIEFEQAHMQKENELLYPAIKKELSGQTLGALSRKLNTGQAAERRATDQAWLKTLADELVHAHA
jgi:hemerythrin-like domain-containing protein